jgi:hypothetical protein
MGVPAMIPVMWPLLDGCMGFRCGNGLGLRWRATVAHTASGCQALFARTTRSTSQSRMCSSIRSLSKDLWLMVKFPQRVQNPTALAILCAAWLAP